MQYAYGHVEVLQDYLGISRDNVLIGVLQHGVGNFEILGKSLFPSPRKTILTRSPIYVYNEEIKKNLRNVYKSDVRVIGSPWNYLPKLEHKSKLPKKTLIVPRRTDFDVNRKADESSLRKKFNYWRQLVGDNEATLSLYYTDITNPIWISLAKEFSFEIACAGMPDTLPRRLQLPSRVDFYKNLKSIYLNHSQMIVEYFSSAIFYGLTCGLSVGLFHERIQSDIPKHINSGLNLIEKEFPSIIENFADIEDVGYELIDKYLGPTLSKESLRELLEFKKVNLV